MWTDQTRKRFQELRSREMNGSLSEAERSELANLLQYIELEEALYLGGATRRVREERERLEGQNRSLENLVQRKEKLVSRLRSVLVEAKTEREAIDAELAAVIGGSPTPQPPANRP